jgi:hypothetical protein
MSDRFGKHKRSDGISFLEDQYLRDWEKDRPHMGGWNSNYSVRLFEIEEQFYRSTRPSLAMEAAVLAVTNELKRVKTRCMKDNNVIPFDLMRGSRMEKALELKEPTLATGLPDMSNPFSSLSNFESAQRMARAISESSLIPKDYHKNIPNCLIALEISQRVKGSVLMVMQNLYVVHGKPGWSAQYIISAINSCGKFSPLRFKMNEDKTSCMAYAIEKATGDTLNGTTITMEMARAEGWSTKSGSKWQTMSEQMLKYRAATFFGRIYAPEILMGFQTSDELEDIKETKEVKSEVVAEPRVTRAQVVRLYTIGDSLGFKHEEVHALMKEFGKTSANDLTPTEYEAVVRQMESKVIDKDFDSFEKEEEAPAV